VFLALFHSVSLGKLSCLEPQDISIASWKNIAAEATKTQPKMCQESSGTDFETSLTFSFSLRTLGTSLGALRRNPQELS
jgi:hypothetical protein